MSKDNAQEAKISNPMATIEKNGRTNTPPPKVVAQIFAKIGKYYSPQN